MTRIAVALALLCLAAPSAAEDAKTLFANRCSACHGKDGKGSPVGQKLGAKDLAATTLSAEELEKVIADGRGKMTAYRGKLTDAQIADLARFVKGGLK
jgi:mono/diheme cytochrome c family protein